MDAYFLGKFAENDIAVFWDIEDCKIGDGSKIGDVAEKIRQALRACGYVGTVSSIRVYGDTNGMDGDEMRSAGITPVHIAAAGVKNARIGKMSDDLLFWIMDHRYDQTNFLLIMGDMSRQFEFVRSLYLMKNKNFNILLSQPPCVKGPLLSAPHKVWFWTSLVDGGAPIPDAQVEELMHQETDFDDYYSDEDYN